jgi:branched-chain amino acid transport system substrate-binding protein
MTILKTMAVAAAGLCLMAGDARAEALKIGVIESLSGAQTSTGRLFVTAANYITIRSTKTADSTALRSR